MKFAGEVYQPRNPLEAREKGVAMIYQELSLAGHLTVEENILLGMEPHRVGFIQWKEVRRKAMEAIRFFEHPEIRPEVPVRQLSVAAQQLVEIARALEVGCRVLVLDEPTSSLTQRDVRQLFRLIETLKEKGHAIIYISHFIEEVQEIADTVTVLRDGRSVGTRAVSDVSAKDIVSMMIGRDVKDLYPRSQRTAGEVLLEVRDLKGRTKPAQASLTVRRGEVVGISGLVGAGRTEFLRALFGLDEIRSGAVKVGTISGPGTPTQRWNQGMGLLSENRKEEGLALSLSIADNATLSRLKGFGPLGLVLPGRQEQAAQHWIEKLGVRCRGPKQSVGAVSGGNQQKGALSRLLQHDVDLLLLDEPTRGIDVAAKAVIYQIIDELATGANGPAKGILVVSSYLPELMGICDRIAEMCRGVLGPARPIGGVTEQSLMLEATGQA